MPGTDRIFLPRRIAKVLRGIYQRRVTVVCAPDGTGKSTLLREFARRCRPEGASLRFIRSAGNSGECFAQISKMITGEPLVEPLTDREYAALTAKFSAASPDKPLVIIVDCPAACQTLFGNLRTAKLLSECECARFVFVCSSLKNDHRELAKRKGFLMIEREQLCMTIAEVAEYAERCGVAANPADLYAASGGSFLSARVCLILAQQGQDYLNLTAEGRIIRALFGAGNVNTAESLRMQGALIVAATYPELSAQFCCDLRSFRSITDYFGEHIFTPQNIISEIERLNGILPLTEINRRSRGVKIHPLLMHAAYTLFFQFPENVRHDMRICFAREYLREDRHFFSFCEYFLAGEYELASGVRSKEPVTYSMLIKSSQLLRKFVNECPMDCKPVIPRLLRITALLMHTDAKPLLADKFSGIIAHISTSPDYDSSDRRFFTGYAYALRTNEYLFVLNKMGECIKRAYELYKTGQRFEAPTFPWTLYAPSVFNLLHRRGYSLQTENDQFVRYQHMYTEMLGHGRYAEIVFTGEMRYYQGDLAGGLERLTAAAALCSAEEDAAMKLTALYAAGKCCLFLGDHLKFFDILDEILAMERKYINREECDCARLCIGMLRGQRGGWLEDMWSALTTKESDVIYNRYTAPYFAMTQAACMLMLKDYEALSESCDKFIAVAENAENECAVIKLRLFCAQAFLSLGDHGSAIRLFSDALISCRDNFTPTAAAEFYSMYPEIFSQLYHLVPDTVQREIDIAAEMGTQFLRGVEAVRTYELTYLNNTRTENYAEHYLVPLDRLMKSTDGLRRSLGLTKAAYSYAILAASGMTNAEISIIFDVSENSVKSSLKRTCAAVGAKNRRELSGIIPTLK
ncbi:MAG: hypothetical protein ACI4WS_05860 [Oscillospiraceae bacterium]